MLDLFAVFTKGGILLWSRASAAIKGDPINALVGHIIERSGETQLTYAPGGPGTSSYTIRWTLDNKLGLVFAAVYQKDLPLSYSADALLSRVARVFARQYPDFEERGTVEFDATFDKLLCDAEGEANGHHVTSEASRGIMSEPHVEVRELGGAISKLSTNCAESYDNGTAEAPRMDCEKSNAFNSDLLSKRFGGAKKKASKEVGPTAATVTKGAKTKRKKARDWRDLDGIKRDEGESQLEFIDGSPEEHLLIENFAKGSLVDIESEDSSDDDEVDDETNDDIVNRGQRSGFLGSFVRNIGMSVVGTDELRRSDIDSSLEGLKKKLMERNVAEDISNKVVESVAASLVGSSLGSFSRISSAVRRSMEEALTRILTPRKPIDILSGIKEAKSRGRPYVIAFVGVNGVGKSTSLAKVAYYLKQHNHRVMVAACDTFRSGAVEQVKVHSQRLGLSLYARGYEKDPAKVAGEAIRAAQKEGCDVVLVDTAGRMQNNEPLMRAITSLVTMNNPDLVLFVGEALAGNDSVDQVVHFNKALATYSTQPNPHVIDGLIISKFETVDEKIGTAISMVFCSGAPIVFLGVGQQYTDLKKLDVKRLVTKLLH